jgi:hypothetical protein
MKKRVGFSLIFIIVSIFIIINEFDTLQSIKMDVEPFQNNLVQCPLPVACGQSQETFDLKCIQNSTGRNGLHSSHAVVSMLLDIEINPLVGGQLDLRFELYVEQLRVLGFLIRSRGNLTCSVHMFIMVKSRLHPKYVKSLHNVGWNFVVIDEIESPRNVSEVLNGHRFVHMFNKLNIFNMTAYDAVLYLDADTVVIRSVSNMFDVYLPEMIRNNVYIGWSADLGNTGNGFYGRNNAGMLLVRPSSIMLQDMIHSMNEISFNASMSEQGFLNAYFKASTELSIPAETFNCMPTNRCFVESKNVSIAHFNIIKPESILWKFRCWYAGIIEMCNAWSQYKRELDTVVDNSRALNSIHI